MPSVIAAGDVFQLPPRGLASSEVLGRDGRPIAAVRNPEEGGAMLATAVGLVAAFTFLACIVVLVPVALEPLGRWTAPALVASFYAVFVVAAVLVEPPREILLSEAGPGSPAFARVRLDNRWPVSLRTSYTCLRGDGSTAASLKVWGMLGRFSSAFAQTMTVRRPDGSVWFSFKAAETEEIVIADRAFSRVVRYDVFAADGKTALGRLLRSQTGPAELDLSPDAARLVDRAVALAFAVAIDAGRT